MEAWREAMKTAIRDGVELCRHLELPARYEAAAARATRGFPVFVPLGFAAKMRRRDPHDPLLRQVLPLAEELFPNDRFRADPLDEATTTVRPGMLQKYNGRVLLITTGACAVHCRYCFRRHYPYAESPPSLNAWEQSLQHLEGDPTVDEVLLSGGDPLTVPDRLLRDLVQRLSEIRHLRRLRIHTRLPIVIPERVTSALLSLLNRSRLTCLVVVHANHAAELDQEVASALGRIVDAGIPLLNQAVLLRGVNDDLETLAALCLRLVELRVMPYYLHQLDPVEGAAHFEVPLEQGLRLIKRLRDQLPGYAVPRYAQERPGERSKRVLA